jgi:hypothetical protein
MSVGKKLLSLFVEVQENEPIKEKSTTLAPTPPTSVPINNSVQLGTVSGEANQTILENLTAALEKANLPGFDYFEYAKTLDALKTSIPSEQVRYQTAFTTAAVMGITKQVLLDAAAHYLKILETEASNFNGYVQEQTKATITDKQGALTDIDNLINEKAAQIQKLTEDINILTQDRAAITNEVSENQVKIGKIQNDFGATLKIFADRITGDVEKINKYING